ncbi:MAG: class II fumarate hydratase [Clostridia bacterium]|jgi:fumarate hydratase class II|nr:class II fumarate hydratase [Clostridia bacterium]MDD4145969.1 class II fumarate hydratase [Clostridia bacterium]MDD4665732.1 class II fumarate hydratase [Clostridia bacterium]
MKKYRKEKDTLGEVLVPAEKLWGAQTQRSWQNFKIGLEKMPVEIIGALVLIKKAAARANYELGLLAEEKQQAIEQACEEILAGQYADNFPLVVWQTGSGTQSNMNVNEVITRRANQLLGAEQVHPNDDVNKGQSSNDVFPSAMHLAAVIALEDRLVPAMAQLQKTFAQKGEEYRDLLKIGRTHLQDATPLTFGQEISAWERMLAKAELMIKESVVHLKELALGGTAVGTGLNTHPQFAEKAVAELNKLTGKQFVPAQNKFHALTSKDELVFAHGALKALAADLMKIANDLRWLASGPRCGLGELTLPANEPGSSIMPGKVNPTQCEALTMVVCQVLGNDVTIGLAASQGNFQLNVFMPVCAYNFLQSVRLLTDALVSFNQHCAQGIKPNREKMQANLTNSLMLVTALNPYLGYEKAAEIAQTAYAEGVTLQEAALKLNLLTAEEFARYMKPEQMV